MIELLGSALLRLGAWALPTVARRFYDQEKLNSQIKIRVRGDGDGVVFNCGEMPSVRVWLRITNLSPIDVEFDRIFGEISCGSRLTAFYDLNRHLIKRAAEAEVFLNVSLTADHATFLRRNRQNNFQTTLSVSGYIYSSLHNYQLPYRELSARNVEFQNCNSLGATP